MVQNHPSVHIPATLAESRIAPGDTWASPWTDANGERPPDEHSHECGVDQISALLDQHNALLDHFIVQVQRNIDQFAPPVDSLVGGAQQALGAVRRTGRR